MNLYSYQKQAIQDLLEGKHLCIQPPGTGKSAVMMRWLAMQKPRKVLIITTASKVKSGDFLHDADVWNGEEWRKKLEKFEIISWNILAKWTEAHKTELSEWVYGFDECRRCCGGTSSGMGKSFLKITLNSSLWAGFTATPGDNWLHFYPYFVACGFVKNKTHFKRRFAIEQNYKGFPEIVGWREEETLKKWWDKISTTPDTSQMYRELPPETYKTIHFDKPNGYDKVRRTRTSQAGEFLETSGAYCAELRRMCFSNDRRQWISDFVEGLGTNVVIFYNFISTGDELAAICEKALKGRGKVWRIDGKHHEIPTAETTGKYDVILCQWQSGSEALNLQHCHYWMGVELCYSYSTFMQSLGRIKRIGQKEPMFFYLLLCKNTIEGSVLECLREKREFSEEVWDKNNLNVKKGE